MTADSDGAASSHAGLWTLALGSIGVVYGDIGTSPLYAFREAITAASPGPDQAELVRAAVLGVASLILWALFIIVTLKYVVILLRADNNGEGGTLTLMALASRAVGRMSRAAGVVALLGIISAALFYGDAVITPALSVLSAVEGVDVVTPALHEYVVPVTVVILIILFAVQSRGTAKVAALFGPIMLIWFAAIALPGLIWIAKVPGVLWALNPFYGIYFLLNHGIVGLFTLGAVFLAVTGAEALYADLGHFGRRPIQVAWIALVLPSLAINYLGQGALIFANPKAIANPFFLLYPDWALIPMVVLATLATVIASQAVITGAYSLTSQAIQLGLLPRFEVRHTSAEQAGQIYMPRVNGLLLLAVLVLVALFRSSSALASAYGIAVTGTMVVTCTMAFIVIWRMWRWSPFAAAALMVPFLVIDLTFLSANMLKVVQGGWVPLLLGGIVMVVMYTWRRGSRILFAKTRRLETPLDDLVRILEKKPPQRVPGHRGVPDQRPQERADGAAAQPQALQGAARKERHFIGRDHAHAARRIGQAGAHRAGRLDLHACAVAFRLHGNAEHSQGAGHRAQARLAVRHHVDVVLFIPAHAAAGATFGHAALARPAVHHAGTLGERCHRLFPDSHRSRGRGRHASHRLSAPSSEVWRR